MILCSGPFKSLLETDWQCWTVSLILFFTFQVYRVTRRWFRPPPSRLIFNTYTIHTRKIRYIHIRNLIKFVSKKVTLLFNIYHILRAFELPSISCHRYYMCRWHIGERKKHPYHHQVTESPPHSLHCSVIWWRTIESPYILVPPFFLFLCVCTIYCSFLPIKSPQQLFATNTVRTIYYDTFIEWSVLYVIFSVLKQMVAVLLLCWSAYRLL